MILASFLSLTKVEALASPSLVEATTLLVDSSMVLAATGAGFSEPVFLTSAVTVLSAVLGEEVTFMLLMIEKERVVTKAVNKLC